MQFWKTTLRVCDLKTNCLLVSVLTGAEVYSYYIQCIILPKLISDSNFTGYFVISAIWCLYR